MTLKRSDQNYEDDELRIITKIHFVKEKEKTSDKKNDINNTISSLERELEK